jgi:Aspartyl protease
MIIAMLAALAGCAANNAVQPASSTATPPIEVLLYAESTRPDELKRIIVPVMLNEQGPFYFLLDTGATRTVIARSAVTRLGLQTDEQRRVGIRSVSSVMRVPTVMMPSLQVGALRSDQLRMPVLSGLVLNGVDGILGMDVLGDTKITADFLKSHVRITSATGAADDNGRLIIAFTQMARRPMMVDAWVGGIRTRAIIDTGCAHTLGNAALLKALQKRLPEPIALRATEISDATDATLPAQLALVPSMIVGRLGIQNLAVSFGEFSVFDTWQIDDRPALLIGMDVLSMVDELAIDYRRKELQVGLVSRRD